ncbi:MAG: hypothetical protein JSV04_09640 [Candidatus Heimdallarchaeota archaeon]|nr:MAG: hypothetical protein JSV04_09640 [Candidatus Heimdallarchaeota archaeon]
MNNQLEPKKEDKGKKNDKKKKKGQKRTFGDNMRQLKFNLTTIRANSKVVFRLVLREIKYFVPLQDLFLLFFWIFLFIVFGLVIVIWGIPLALSIIPNDPFKAYDLHINLIKWDGIIFNDTTLRYGAGIIGTVTIIVRLMIKSPISKYRDKVNTRKDVTYVFGTSRPAEQFLFEMIFQFGYEERVSLIADNDLLWIRKLRAFIDIYVVENQLEFEKENLYDIIGFENASRIMILTESIELNQNILTNIRRIRPDVDIILLSQYAPAFVFSELVQDQHLMIIEDLDATVQGLVLSLSMDFNFPPTVEIDVPRTYIGSTGVAMTSDLVRQKVLLVRRGDELLSPEEKLKLGDRVIIYFFSDYFMKMTNRVVTELPLLPKKSKTKKEKKKDKKKGKEEIEINALDEELVIPTIEEPVVKDTQLYDSTTHDEVD